MQVLIMDSTVPNRPTLQRQDGWNMEKGQRSARAVRTWSKFPWTRLLNVSNRNGNYVHFYVKVTRDNKKPIYLRIFRVSSKL